MRPPFFYNIFGVRERAYMRALDCLFLQNNIFLKKMKKLKKILKKCLTLSFVNGIMFRLLCNKMQKRRPLLRVIEKINNCIAR